MDTVRSNFIRALDHFWNNWATSRKDIILIVCGSATSWIIDNIVMNYGGLHNRLTKKIHLHPFTLHECELFCKSQNLGYKRNMIMEAYMALGGIPYYWSFLQKGLSVAQNFDRMFFGEDGELAQEYEALYASLFKNPRVHISIINTLSTKKVGMTRNERLSGKYTLSSEELDMMQNRINTLQQETGTTKSINLTLITSNGVTSGSDTHNIHSMLTMDDLFL